MQVASKDHFLISIFILPLFFSLVFAPPVHSSGRKGTIVIGLIPEMDVFKQMKRFQPLADFLSEKLNTEVKLSMLSRYGNIVGRIKEKKLDAAFLGSFTGALAISQLGLEPIVRPVNLDGTSSYYALIFVRKESQIKNAADMRGKTFAFVERATTAGYIFPLAFLKKNKVTELDNYFSNYFFTGSHDLAINSVLSGRIDIGAAKNTIYERLQKENPDIDQKLTILARSARVPSNALFAGKDMLHAKRQRIGDFLMGLPESPAGRTVLEKLGAQGFVKTTAEDFKPVFDMAAEANINISNYHYVNQ